jgi:hypothetical protein
MDPASLSRAASPNLTGFFLGEPEDLKKLLLPPLALGGAGASAALDVDAVAAPIFGFRDREEGRELPSVKKPQPGRFERVERSLDDELDGLSGAMNCMDAVDGLEKGTKVPRAPHRNYTQERRDDGLFYLVPKEPTTLKEEGAKKRKFEKLTLEAP